MTPSEKKGYAELMFSRHPEFFPEQYRDPILRGRIEIGMTPFEAKLAGGAFAFKVIADAARWPKNSDPYKVMWAQSSHPDNSEIWMTFKNSTQFLDESEHIFRVHFWHGKVVEIEKIGG